MALSKDKWVRRFVISETSRHKKGFTIYKVTSVMFLKTSPEVVSKVSIWKRYSDFKKLYSSLQSLHSTHQIKEPFPHFPKPKFFGRFEAEVIEQRRKSALKLMEFIGRHNILFTSDVFVKFFESDNLDKKFFDCSHSLSSDTSEDDKNIKCMNDESTITNATDVPKFVCTRKVTPIIVGRQTNIKSKTSVNDGLKISKDHSLTDQHHDVNRNNDLTNNLNDVVNGMDALTSEETQIKSKNPVIRTVVIHDGSDLIQFSGESAQYILIAAAHMSAAFRHEAIAEYEEAFTQYKLGISHLINGIQTEDDREKKLIVQEKISKYLQRAERLYHRHLNCNVSALHKSVSELRNYKVIELMESIMLVRDTLQGFKRVVKTVEKEAGSKKDISSYILRGKVPYMVQLYACMQTDSTVFLILQYMSKGKLWDYLKINYKLDEKKENFTKKGHTRSSSCNAAIQIDLLGESCTQEKLPEIEISHEEVNSPITSEINFNGLNKLAPEDTNELVQNAQKLLQSVNATLKRSNSIASRLNESERLLYKQNEDIEHSISDLESALRNDSLNADDEDTEGSGNLGKFSISNSCTELQYDSYEEINVDTQGEPRISSIIIKNKESEKMYSTDELIIEKSCIPSESFKMCEKVDNCYVGEEKEMWAIPESVARIWAAQILSALEALHQQDVIMSDLRPDNILIDDSGNVSMTYVIPRKNPELTRLKKPYSSPELCMFTPPVSITTSADVWSFGVLLYEMLTGFEFESKHPGQFHSHSIINIPDNLSENAKSLLLNVLKYQPSERLTIPEVKQHLFFSKIDWLELLNA